MKDKSLSTFEELKNSAPIVSEIITEELAERVFAQSEYTGKHLAPTWRKHMRQNFGLYEKHGSFMQHFRGFGTNKAVIAVGAGPSFNRNKETLKAIYQANLFDQIENQPFIIFASNKQFKPLLEMGIYPHMTLLIDSGDALYPQLCKKIPKWAKKSILIAGLHTAPRILKKWDEQGGQICFYLIGEEPEKELFHKHTGEDPEPIHVSQGGNVLNTMWIMANVVLNSTTFIMVGNDLAYKYSDSKEERAKSFYADGDYRLNILNDRDEAKDKMAWMGFTLEESMLQRGRYIYNLDIVSLSRQLWLYKAWMEVQAAVWEKQKSFFIYNCSEAGSLGVLARDYSKEAMFSKDNWYLIDEILPKRWCTTTLQTAAMRFLEARKCLFQGVMPEGAGSAIVLPGKTDIVKPIGQNAILL